MNNESNTLVARAVAGDAAALTQLLALHGPEVQRRLNIARRWRGAIESDDVMQVTYLEAFLQIARFDPTRDRTFAAWLERIAENNLRDAIRGLSRRKRPPVTRRVMANETGAGGAWQDSRDQLLELIGTTSATPSRALRREEAHGLLDEAIRELPDDYSAVIRGYDLQGQDIAVVGAEMKRSPGAVHMLRARAHERLREILGSAVVSWANRA